MDFYSLFGIRNRVERAHFSNGAFLSRLNGANFRSSRWPPCLLLSQRGDICHSNWVMDGTGACHGAPRSWQQVANSRIEKDEIRQGGRE